MAHSVGSADSIRLISVGSKSQSGTMLYVLIVGLRHARAKRSLGRPFRHCLVVLALWTYSLQFSSSRDMCVAAAVGSSPAITAITVDGTSAANRRDWTDLLWHPFRPHSRECT